MSFHKNNSFWFKGGFVPSVTPECLVKESTKSHLQEEAIKKIEEEKSKKNTVKTFYFRNGDSLLLPFIVSEEICENHLFVRTKDNEETVYDINLKEINFIKTEYKENF